MRLSAVLLLLLAVSAPVAAQDRTQVPPPGLPPLPADGPMRFDTMPAPLATKTLEQENEDAANEERRLLGLGMR